MEPGAVHQLVGLEVVPQHLDPEVLLQPLGLELPLHPLGLERLLQPRGLELVVQLLGSGLPLQHLRHLWFPAIQRQGLLLLLAHPDPAQQPQDREL